MSRQNAKAEDFFTAQIEKKLVLIEKKLIVLARQAKSAEAQVDLMSKLAETKGLTSTDLFRTANDGAKTLSGIDKAIDALIDDAKAVAKPLPAEKKAALAKRLEKKVNAVCVTQLPSLAKKTEKLYRIARKKEKAGIPSSDPGSTPLPEAMAALHTVHALGLVIVKLSHKLLKSWK